MFQIVGIGAVYQDTILNVPFYPSEDSKLQATSVESRIGGNVFNTLAILSQLRRYDPEDLVLAFVGAFCEEHKAR